MTAKTPKNTIEIKAVRLSHGLGLPFPEYQSEEAAGLDLLAAVPVTSPVRLLPGTRALIPTGLTLELPAGFEGQVRPRSGLALNHGVTVLNSPGTVDADYRGEIMVLLVNLGRETFVITRGQRIAQLVVQPVARAEIVDVRAVAATKRAVAGFGSTGIDMRPEPVVQTIATRPDVAVAKASVKHEEKPPAAPKQTPPAKPIVAAKPVVAAKPAPSPVKNGAKPAAPARPALVPTPAKPISVSAPIPAKIAGKTQPGRADAVRAAITGAAAKAAAKPAARPPAKAAPRVAAKAVAKPPVKTGAVAKASAKKPAAPKRPAPQKGKAAARA
jgi:dUTP pyrophosphatase